MLLKASCFNKYIETHDGLSALKYGGGIKYFYSIPTLISSDKIRFLFQAITDEDGVRRVDLTRGCNVEL